MNARKLATALTIALSSAAIACGGPDIDQVKQDFESPSGSVTDKDAIVAANAKRDGSDPALSIAGGGVPGFGLTAYGKSDAFKKLNVRRTWESNIRDFHQHWAAQNGIAVPARGAQVEDFGTGCDDSPEVQAAMEALWRDLVGDALLGSKSASGSASYTLDLATCSEYTGKISVDIEMKLSENSFSFKIDETFTNVCSGDQECVTGDVNLEAAADADEAGQAGQLTFVTAWKLAASWLEDGVAKTASLKGGVRSLFNENGIDIEYLFYVTTPNGEEYSYVFKLVVDENGARWEIRGKNGSISCKVDENGGECTGTDANGTATVAWTKEEARALDASWFGN